MIESPLFHLYFVVTLYPHHLHSICQQLIYLNYVYNIMLLKLTLRVVREIARKKAELGQVRTTSPIIQGKKVDRQLMLLKRNLASKQSQQTTLLYDQYHHTEIYKKIDTDIQAFFYKRSYNIENFNFLINLLGHQHKSHKISQILQKMSIMKIQPDEKTYNYIIKAYSYEQNIKETQRYFKEACQRFGESKYFYTSLMTLYIREKDSDMAYKILQEMIEKGIQPDLPVYTTLINAFRMSRKLQKCWELNRLMLKKGFEVDETYVGVMLKVHAATHDAEKAIKLYKESIVQRGIKPMLQTTNSYLKALSTRPEYSMKVIDKFFQMIEIGEIINEETIRWTLKAASTTANVKSAIEIVKIMTIKNIQPTKQIYNSLIRVYAKACDIPDLPESYRDMMMMDTWKILQEVINKKMLDTIILNNVILVYANALQQDKIQGLILPLFDKFNLEMNPHTYEILIDMSYKKKDFKTAMRVWQQMKVKLQEKKSRSVDKYGQFQTNLALMNEDLRPTFNALELYIQIGIRLMNMHMILEALSIFKQMNRHPKNSTLKFLGNLTNLPEEIQVSLMDFKIRFGAAKLAKTKTNSQKMVKDPQNL